MKLIKECAGCSWNIYIGSNDNLMAVPTEQAASIGCKESHYGKREHLAGMMAKGAQTFEGFTEDGLELMSGLYNRILRFDQEGAVDIGLRFG